MICITIFIDTLTINSRVIFMVIQNSLHWYTYSYKYQK
jgi:hypothetical protein